MMKFVQLVLFSSLLLMFWTSVVSSGSLSYLPPTIGGINYPNPGNAQVYYPSRPVILIGGYYKPGHGHGHGHYYRPGVIGGGAQGGHYYTSSYNGATGSGQYFNPLETGIGSGQYYTPSVGGLIGSGSYFTPSVGAGFGSGQHYGPSVVGVGATGIGHYPSIGSGIGSGGEHFGKPGYKPQSVIETENGYVYGKKK